VCVCVCVCIDMSICRERKGERQRERGKGVCVYRGIDLHIHCIVCLQIYICVKGVREGGRESEMQGACKARV
jgi:hypothetical protein